MALYRDRVLAGLNNRGRVLRQVATGFVKQLHIDLNYDPSKSIFLGGSGRGGTTWIAELINYDNSYRFIFEPFYPSRVKACRHFGYRRYIRPTQLERSDVKAAEAVVSGRVRSDWSDLLNKRLISGRRIIKEIRANLFMKWLHCLFPTTPMILLLRHPCAVAKSRMRLRWSTDVNSYLAQKALMEDFLGPFADRISGARDDFERYVYLWCIENYVPLHQFRKGQVHLAFFEKFHASPEEEIGRLFAFLNRPVDDGVFDRLGKPSSQARSRDRRRFELSPVGRWQKETTADEIRRAINILGAFGLDDIYGPEAMPNDQAAQRILGD